MEKELGVEIGNGLANDLPKALAGAPPLGWIVARAIDRDDANFDIVSKSFLIQQPGFRVCGPRETRFKDSNGM